MTPSLKTLLIVFASVLLSPAFAQDAAPFKGSLTCVEDLRSQGGAISQITLRVLGSAGGKVRLVRHSGPEGDFQDDIAMWLVCYQYGDLNISCHQKPGKSYATLRLNNAEKDGRQYLNFEVEHEWVYQKLNQKYFQKLFTQNLDGNNGPISYCEINSI
jgi:hypothetical protein